MEHVTFGQAAVAVLTLAAAGMFVGVVVALISTAWQHRKRTAPPSDWSAEASGDSIISDHCGTSQPMPLSLAEVEATMWERRFRVPRVWSA